MILFDDELNNLKKSILDGESPITKLGMVLDKHEYTILQLYLEGSPKQILDLINSLCEAELHRMTAENILWRD
jgi:hypothetical protein